MTLRAIATLNLFAQITAGDALADASSVYNLGFINHDLAALLPGDADAPDLVYTKEFVLGAGLTKAFNMETMQITTIDSAQPRNPDGETFSLGKIFAIALKLLSTSNNANDFGIKLVNDTWAQELNLSLAQEGGLAFVFFPEGAAVNAGELSNLIETGNDGSSVTVQMWVLGKLAPEPTPTPTPT